MLLNHSASDRSSAENVHRSLRVRGWSVDGQWQLPVAHRVEEYLETILPTVGCIVTLWTESSSASHLVRDLAHEAHRLGIGVPVLLDDVTLPLALRAIPPLDFRSHELNLPQSSALNELVDAVETVLVGSGYPNSGAALEQPSLSIRVARRVLDALRQQDAVQQPNFRPLVRFQLGDWSVDVGANTLTRENTTRRLAPRSMEVLAYLSARSHETISVEEVLHEIWRNRIVVDTVVHKCVRELRVALDDDYRNPSYIETHRKRGYRVIAKIDASYVE